VRLIHDGRTLYSVRGDGTAVKIGVMDDEVTASEIAASITAEHVRAYGCGTKSNCCLLCFPVQF